MLYLHATRLRAVPLFSCSPSRAERKKRPRESWPERKKKAARKLVSRQKAEINDSSSTLQQYLRFTTTRKRFEPDYNLFTFPLVHSIPLNTIVPIIETKSTLTVERLTLI